MPRPLESRSATHPPPRVARTRQRDPRPDRSITGIVVSNGPITRLARRIDENPQNLIGRPVRMHRPHQCGRSGNQSGRVGRSVPLAVSRRSRASGDHVYTGRDQSNLRSLLGLCRYSSVPVNGPDTNYIRQRTRILKWIPRLRLISNSGNHQDALGASGRKNAVQLGDIFRGGWDRIHSLRNADNLGTLVNGIGDSLSDLLKEISGDEWHYRPIVNLQGKNLCSGRQAVSATAALVLTGACNETGHLGSVPVGV